MNIIEFHKIKYIDGFLLNKILKIVNRIRPNKEFKLLYIDCNLKNESKMEYNEFESTVNSHLLPCIDFDSIEFIFNQINQINELYFVSNNQDGFKFSLEVYDAPVLIICSNCDLILKEIQLALEVK